MQVDALDVLANVADDAPRSTSSTTIKPVGCCVEDHLKRLFEDYGIFIENNKKGVRAQHGVAPILYFSSNISGLHQQNCKNFERFQKRLTKIIAMLYLLKKLKEHNLEYHLLYGAYFCNRVRSIVGLGPFKSGGNNMGLSDLVLELEDKLDVYNEHQQTYEHLFTHQDFDWLAHLDHIWETDFTNAFEQKKITIAFATDVSSIVGDSIVGDKRPRLELDHDNERKKRIKILCQELHQLGCTSSDIPPEWLHIFRSPRVGDK